MFPQIVRSGDVDPVLTKTHDLDMNDFFLDFLLYSREPKVSPCLSCTCHISVNNNST